MTLILGLIFSIVGIITIKPLSILIGATGETLEYCITYGVISFAGITFFMLQNVFQNFCVVAERPKFGLFISIFAGVTNMVLDALLVWIIPLGVAGAAIATVSSQIVGCIIPILYFLRKNSSLLKLSKTKLEFKPIFKACTNGSSELMSNLSNSVVNFFFNLQLMKYAGINGVDAFGVIMYATFIFAAVYIGYSVGSAPLISYNFGSKNHFELKNLLKKSLISLTIAGVTICTLSQALSHTLSSIFVGYDKELLNLTVRGMRLFCLSFIFMGLNIFGSSFFTALNNGLISGIIAFVRTLCFQLISVLTLPLILGIDGSWISVVIGEFASLILTVIFLFAKRKKYNY